LAGYLRKGIKAAPAKIAAARERLRVQSLSEARRPRKYANASPNNPPTNTPVNPVAKNSPTFWVERLKTSSPSCVCAECSSPIAWSSSGSPII
jgi:hypothetical protein